jgi:hypothetical protein
MPLQRVNNNLPPLSVPVGVLFRGTALITRQHALLMGIDRRQYKHTRRPTTRMINKVAGDVSGRRSQEFSLKRPKKRLNLHADGRG